MEIGNRGTSARPALTAWRGSRGLRGSRVLATGLAVLGARPSEPVASGRVAQPTARRSNQVAAPCYTWPPVGRAVCAGRQRERQRSTPPSRRPFAA